MMRKFDVEGYIKCRGHGKLILESGVKWTAFGITHCWARRFRVCGVEWWLRDIMRRGAGVVCFKVNFSSI